MAISYKLHRMIEEDIFNQDLMRMSNIFIITKLGNISR